mmetsp:Transcript_108338/g.198366  ORF Transcript_108338/g.198366 Transcript_108338/m.198366 type:complete len:225 (+) Transcript_108338:1311-1985(+)
MRSQWSMGFSFGGRGTGYLGSTLTLALGRSGSNLPSSPIATANGALPVLAFPLGAGAGTEPVEATRVRVLGCAFGNGVAIIPLGAAAGAVAMLEAAAELDVISRFGADLDMAPIRPRVRPLLPPRVPVRRCFIAVRTLRSIASKSSRCNLTVPPLRCASTSASTMPRAAAPNWRVSASFKEDTAWRGAIFGARAMHDAQSAPGPLSPQPAWLHRWDAAGLGVSA